MAAIHSIPARSTTPDLLDARDARDAIDEKLAVLWLALTGLRASGDAVTPRMVDPLIALAAELRTSLDEAIEAAK